MVVDDTQSEGEKRVLAELDKINTRLGDIEKKGAADPKELEKLNARAQAAGNSSDNIKGMSDAMGQEILTKLNAISERLGILEGKEEKKKKGWL